MNYPTQEWLDNWMDKWMEKHPNERITDFSKLREKAEQVWWDNEIEHNRPTPYDMTAEEKKAQKAVKKGMAKNLDKVKTEVKRERKPNDEKRHIINLVKVLFQGLALNGEVSEVEIPNIEKEITFKVGENCYSLTLTAHRKPKN